MTSEEFNFDRLIVDAHLLAFRRGAEIALDDAECRHSLMMHTLEIAPRYEDVSPGITEDAERAVQRAELHIARARAFMRTVNDD